jgi:hypothetical protein
VARWQSLPATGKLVKKLKRFGFNIWNQLPKGEASQLIEECDRLDERCPTPAAPGQERLLRGQGQWQSGLGKRAATRLFAGLMKRAG